MRLVYVREGRVGYHVGDTVDVPDDVTAIDLTYCSHIDSDRSQAVLAEVGKDPEGNPIRKPGSDNNEGEN